jgi:flagellar biosynthesis chaperone FliJ
MKIKKFFETELQGPDGPIDIVNDISQEAAEDIIKKLKNQESSNQKYLVELESIERQLSKFKSSSKKSNDRIDNSIIELQQLINTLKTDIQPKIDTLTKNMEDYISNGRNYIL